MCGDNKDNSSANTWEDTKFADQSQSNLFKLPIELRLQIYREACLLDKRIFPLTAAPMYDPEHSHLPRDDYHRGFIKEMLPLQSCLTSLMACKAVWSEASEIPFEVNTFLLLVPTSEHGFPGNDGTSGYWLLRKGQEQTFRALAARIRKVRIEAGVSDFLDYWHGPWGSRFTSFESRIDACVGLITMPFKNSGQLTELIAVASMGSFKITHEASRALTEYLLGRMIGFRVRGTLKITVDAWPSRCLVDSGSDCLVPDELKVHIAETVSTAIRNSRPRILIFKDQGLPFALP